MSDTPKLLALMVKCKHTKAYEYAKQLEGLAREVERENAALRSAAVEVCALARVWATVWHDKLSDESVQLFTQLEKQILKEVQR